MTEPVLQTVPRQDPAMCPLDFKFGLRLKFFPHFQPSLLCLGRREGYLCSRSQAHSPQHTPGEGKWDKRGVSRPSHRVALDQPQRAAKLSTARQDAHDASDNRLAARTQMASSCGAAVVRSLSQDRSRLGEAP